MAGIINISDGQPLVNNQLTLVYNHGYPFASDNDRVTNVNWYIFSGPSEGGYVRNMEQVDGPLDNSVSGPRNPQGVFQAYGEGYYNIRCTALIWDDTAQYSYTYTELLLITVTANAIINVSKYTILKYNTPCDLATIMVYGKDSAGIALEFDRYQINDGVIQNITSASEVEVTKERDDTNWKIKLFATNVTYESAFLIDQDNIPLMPDTISYTINWATIVIEALNGYTYSYDGGAWTYNNQFTFPTAGTKTVLIADNWGCVKTIEVIATVIVPIDLDAYKSTFYNSKANSLRIVEQEDFDYATIYPNDENTFGCETPYKDTRYYDKQRVKKDFNIVQQFKSGYDVHFIDLNTSEGVQVGILPVTKVQQNIKYEDIRPYLYLEDDSYSYLYFDSCRQIPYYYKVGGTVTIDVESHLILAIVYLDSEDKWAIQTEKFATYGSTDLKYIYNRQIYDVYEFSLGNDLLPDGEYWVHIAATRQNATDPNENKTTIFKSVPIIVADEFEHTADIRYYNNRNNDIYWQSGIVGFLTIGVDYRIPIGETENTAVGTDDSTYLEKSYGREKYRYMFEPLTDELNRKLVAALSQYSVFINGQRYVFDSVSLESIGDYTNDSIVVAEGYKSIEDDYEINSIGSYVGGFHEGSAITLQHKDCNTLKNLTDPNVVVTFDAPFSTIPQGVANLKLYKMVYNYGFWIAQEVLHNFPSEQWLTPTGFSVNVDASEIIGGVIIEYCFYE